MVRTSNEEEVLKNINEQLISLLAISIPEMNFSNRPDLTINAHRIISHARVLETCIFDGIPYDRLTPLRNWLRSTLSHLQDLERFPAGTINDETSLANALNSDWEGEWLLRSSIISYSQLANGEDAVQVLLERCSELKSQLEELCKQTEKRNQESVEKVQVMYGQAVIAKHAGNFKEEAENQERAAAEWLVCISLKMAGEWPVLGRQVAFNVAGCEGVGYF